MMKVTDSQNKNDRTNFGSYLRGIGAFAFLVTIFMAGFGISSANWSSSNATLQNDLRHTQEDLSKARQELSDVKSEYAVFREKNASAASTLVAKDSSTEKSSVVKAPGDFTSVQTAETVTVGTEKTGYAFDNTISISLAATPFEGDPLRHKVIATIGSSGLPSLTIDRKDVGYTTTYKAKDSYEILVTAADTFSAQFRVSKLQK